MRSVLWTVAITLIGGVAFTQGDSEPPKPGPEHKELGYFVGKWNTEGEAKATPFSPARKWSGAYSYEWLPGEFFLLRRLESNFSDGVTVKSVQVFGYDPESKMYTSYAVNSRGGSNLRRLTLTKDTWTTIGEQTAGGKTFKTRTTLKLHTPDAFDYKQEYSEDGKTWTAFAHAKDTKVK
jgi:hypothetical protein